MNKTVFALVCSLALCAASAYGEGRVVDTINAVKLNDAYVTADVSDADEHIAYDCAMTELADIVNDLREEEGKGEIDADDLRPLCERINYKRGARHAVFVYVEKTEALDIVKKTPRQQATAADSTSVQSERTETGERERATEGQETESKTQSRSYASVNALLLEAGDYFEACRFLQMFKEKGEIAEFDAAKTGDDIPADAYKMLVSGNDYTISAILSPQNINIVTDKSDNINNYSHHGVLWYK